MKQVLLVLLFAILSFYSKAQFEFKYDTIEQRNQKDIRDIEALYPLSQEADFQLRFWMLPGEEAQRTLLLLLNKNQQWQARYFERTKEGNKLSWKEHPIAQNGLEKLWNGLQENDVLNIKSSIDLKTSEGSPAYQRKEGGVLYFFELLDQKGKRAYYYHCPKHQQQYYDHKEFIRVVNMIQLINDFRAEKHKPIC